MQVPNLGVSNSSLPSQTQVAATPSAADAAPLAGATSTANGYTPSSEWLNLISQARQEPDVRSDLVEAATARLQQGYYSTQSSFEGTAAAMLAAQD